MRYDNLVREFCVKINPYMENPRFVVILQQQQYSSFIIAQM